MKVVVFNPAGGPIIAEVTSGQAQPGSYTLRVWEAHANTLVLKERGADLRTNANYIDTVTAIATKINDIYDNARDRVGPPPKPIELTSAEEDSITALQAP